MMPLHLINRVIAALLISALVALGGCSTPFGQSKYADDPLYGLGYSDGCGTGTGYNPADKSSVVRDPEGWSKSKAYRAGWKKGFNACRPSASGNSSAYPADAQGRRNGPSGY
tara:strand:- start:1344 stop:1679 length:336 start_codon:yes stop_codon:yes gene_type:complete